MFPAPTNLPAPTSSSIAWPAQGGPSAVSTSLSLQEAATGGIKRRMLPVTGIANKAGVSMNTTMLKHRLKSMNMSVLALASRTGCCRSSVYRWVVTGKNVPWRAIEKIADAVKLEPELLGEMPREFDCTKFRHYLRQRCVALETLVNADRLGSYSYSAISRWLRGAIAPPPEAIQVLEGALGLKGGALTDGPLEEVPAFTPAETEQWSALIVNSQDNALSSASRPIKDVLRSWREENGLTWGQFSMMIPGYRATTVMCWLRGHAEPSMHGIAALEKVMGLATGTLVKRNRAGPSPYQLTQLPNRARAPRRVSQNVTRMSPPLHGEQGPSGLDGGQASATDRGIAAPLPPEELEGLIPLMFEALAQSIRTPQQWGDNFDDLIPRLMVRLPGWPQGRDLCIDRADGPGLMCRGGGSDPAPVRLYRQRRDYYGVEYGQPLAVTPDGDRFFRALLISMGSEQPNFFEALSLGWDRSESAVIAALRGQLAQYVMAHRAEVAPLLFACSLRVPSSL